MDYKVIEFRENQIDESYIDHLNTLLDIKDKKIKELEHKNEVCEAEVFAITQRNIELEIALDKACLELEKMCYKLHGESPIKDNCEWKEWCLNDE